MNGMKPLEKNEWSQGKRLLVVLFFSLVLFSLVSPRESVNRLKISYTNFKNLASGGKIAQITVRGDEITGEFKGRLTEELKPPQSGEDVRLYENFRTTKPPFADPDLLNLLEQNGVMISAESQESSWLRMVVIGWLPWLLILGLFLYSSRRLQGGMGGGIFGFAKSKAKLYTRETSNVGFKDVAGLANTKKELEEIVGFLKNPAKYKSLGGELPKGILLVGPPGTGKTLMARATAGEANVPFYSISGSEFIEMFVGVGASRVRDMFTKAKSEAPSIIFIDELDSIGRVRGTGLGGGHDEREQTLNQILAEMDGFSPHVSVVVLAATNRPDVLDPALIRPGRFDRQITLDLPQRKARKEILDVHTRNVPLGPDVDLDLLSRRTVGFSGAELKNLVNEAALLAARKEKRAVDAVDFEEGRDKILMGIEREDIIRDEEKEVIAIHEAGHAILARILPGADPLEKVSIIPRGRSLGATEQIPEEDQHNLSRRYLRNRIAIMLGGRVAEKITKQDISTGAGDDLRKATELARRMICQWGMSDRIGPVTYRQGETHPFLGREMSQPRDFSERTAQIIDEEVRDLIQSMEAKAEKLIVEHRDEVDALARELFERETLSKEEIDEILGPITQSPPWKREEQPDGAARKYRPSGVAHMEDLPRLP
ncbi:MAG: cell division protein FtsH [Deltaproteobacteria bacterium HGW-Deltaproteobacteria-15]|jgi:cell division protease FtsH|nr:MAG: cell division protein FtsH [Deltaproteobacteria bacterium HGW-Deltaproteobacteria-15]